MPNKYQIAILDDYQDVALATTDWDAVKEKADITIFEDHLFETDLLVERLKAFQIICVMRERTPLTREIFQRLPNLRLVVSTGRRNASIDLAAAAECNVEVANTGYVSSGAPELTWALLMAIAKRIPQEHASLRSGGWQLGVGADLKGKTIGIVGLGNIGKRMAAFAKAFEMEVLAWSANLTEAAASEAGARLVSKETLFGTADFVTVHLVLGERTRGIVGEKELGLMKPGAYFINTSRGPLVDEAALINCLQNGKIAGAALDVFDQEPLPVNHPFRTLPNVLATPHIGYVTAHTYQVFFEDTVKIIAAWLDKNE